MTSRAELSISVDSVSVAFGGLLALQDVSCHLAGPSVVGMVGPNGSGKSTLLGVLSGLVQPTTGHIRLNGEAVTGKNSLQFSRRGVRRSFQIVRLVPNLTVGENLLIGVGRPTSATLQRARELCERFGITPYLRRWPAAVPAGIQRLAQVIAVLLTEPRVVLLDEPAAGLTGAECAGLVELVRECGQRALTIVVEHNMQVIYDVAEHVILLLSGRVASEGTVVEIRDNAYFQEMYLGRSIGEGAPVPVSGTPEPGRTSAQ